MSMASAPATDLAQQLGQRASRHGVDQEQRHPGKASLLYTFQEAADIDVETIYRVGVEGLDQLCALDGRFQAYRRTLFGQASQSLDRDASTADVNAKLDSAIAGFCTLLSSYFLLAPAFKALEFLVRKYKVHERNVDELMLAALPYHETEQFVRLVQILRLQPRSRFAFLEPMQQSGAPAPREALVLRCVTDRSLLRFVCEMAQRQADPRVAGRTALPFYAVLACEFLAKVKSVDEPLLTFLLPYLLAGLNGAAVADYRAATYMIIGQLASRATFTADLATVADLMTTGALRAANPQQPLSSAASKLDKVTGLAVVDEENRVVGVISIRDINRLKKQGVSMDEKVGQHMSTPPIVVRPDTTTGEAAAIMLAKKIHRLPVVDDEGRFIGIISRTDIFQRALAAKNEFYQELAAYGEDYLGAAGVGNVQRSLQATFDEEDECEKTEASWQVKYLYDGDCSMCLSLVAMLRRQDDGQGRIKFVNIASVMYDSNENEGILYEEAMETIHAIKRDGTIMKGPDALKLMYSTVGLGWAAQFGDLPIISTIVDWVYELLSKLRMPMGRGMDAVLAMRRMKMTNEGIEHCVDDEEECQAEW